MVLTHTTGLSVDQLTSQKALKGQFAVGLPPLPAAYEYSNANYDLTRFLLPHLTLPTMTRAVMTSPPGAEDSDWGKAHIAHVKQKILKPCGLTAVDVVYTGPPPKTRYYANLANQAIFDESNTLQQAQEFVGAGWWTMSAREYGLFIDRLRAGRVLPDIWKVMRDNRAETASDVGLGLFRMAVPDGDAFFHNGAVRNRHSSAWMALPHGVSVVICRNSGDMGPAPQSVIRTAYEKALT